MNGKLILSVLLALVLVGAAVTIVNAQDQNENAPANLTPSGLSAQDHDTDYGVADSDDHRDSPLQPVPVSHGGGGEGEEETDGNETTDPENETDRGPGDAPPGEGDEHCDCPDSGPQGQGADMDVEKDGEFHQVNETHADRVRFIVTVENVGVFTAFNVGVSDRLPDLGSE